MIVVDASVLVDVLLRRREDLQLERRLFDGGESLHAPHLIDLETAHVLRRFAAARLMDNRRAAEGVEDLALYPIIRHSHTMLLPRIWTLRHVAGAYDAAYLALAEALGATLVTRDRRLARVVGHAATVELL